MDLGTAPHSPDTPATHDAAAVYVVAQASRSPSPLRAADGGGAIATASRVATLAAPESGIFLGYRQAREDWSSLAARYAKEPAIQAWARGEMTRVDAWMTRKFERPDLVSGWMHDLVDPNTGMPATWTAASAEPSQGASDKERKFKAAWVGRGRSYNINQVQAAARLFKLTGQSKYAQWAADQLDFYADNYGKWPLQTFNGRSRMFGQGLDEATHAFLLLDATRLLEGYASASRQAHWREALFEPMADNLRYPQTQLNNMSLWRKAAMSAIAMRYGIASLQEEALNGPTGVNAILARCVTADNLWIEGSFLYNNYVVNALSQLLVRASIEGHDAEFTGIKTTALKLLLAPIDYAFDNGTLPNPSDSTAVQPAISINAHWQLARVATTWWGAAQAAKVRNWDSLLDPLPPVGAEPPSLPKPATRNFPAVRHAVLRAGDWQAYVHYGQLDANHYQQEMLNFELYDGKTDISTDAGTVSYGSPYSSDYFRKGAGNNVPLIDGEGQPKPAPGNIVTFSAPESRLVVEQPAYQPGASVRRSFQVTTTGFNERTEFTLSGNSARRLGISFNTGCAVKPASGLTGATAAATLPNASAFSYWKNVSAFTAQSRWTIELDCSGKRYALTVRGPEGQQVFVGKAPDTPLPKQRQSVYYEVKGATAAFDSEIKALP